MCGEIQRLLHIGNTGINYLVRLKLCCSYIVRKLIYGPSFSNFWLLILTGSGNKVKL